MVGKLALSVLGSVRTVVNASVLDDLQHTGGISEVFFRPRVFRSRRLRRRDGLRKIDAGFCRRLARSTETARERSYCWGIDRARPWQ